MAPPDPPEISHPFTAERVANIADEFSMLTGRYGEPNFIRPPRSERLARIPVGVAEWSVARINIAFVPNGCVRIYDQILELERGPVSDQRRRSRNIMQCHPRPGWTIVAYHDADTDLELSASGAARLLNTIGAPEMRIAPAEIVSTPASLPSAKDARGGSPLPSMISTVEARTAAQQKRDSFQARQSRARLSSRIALTCSIPVLFMGFSAHRKNIRKRETQLIYELDSASAEAHDVTQQALGCLSACRRVWRVESKSATSDWKRNAGAAYLVKRTAIRAGSFSPPRVKTNVPVLCLDLDSSKFYFLPDTILYWDHRGFGAVAYSDFQVKTSATRFIESNTVPDDAVVVDHTWRYVNKDGGPDRRFNNNRRFPILQLGVLTFQSSGGMNIHLNTSNPIASNAFADRWNSRFSTRSDPKTEKQRRSNSDSRPKSPERYAAAREVLGVEENALPEQIAEAYHRLARMYHPDRVAGLAPDIQELAGRKMREINAAYEALKAT
ncbi:MAG TPA: J domain-containing protein [Bryobacteraceae bacterium]